MSEDKPRQETRCWLCEGSTEPHATLRSAGYWQCSGCGFIFQPGRDSAVDEVERYTADYFGEYGGQSYEDPATRVHEAERRVDMVAQHLATGRLLELGAASGWFVAECIRRGYDAEGVEPSDDTAQLARDRGIPVHTGTLASAAASGRTYDAVCAWHVLEHLPYPLIALEQVNQLLKPGGVLLLEVPNVGSVAARRHGASWKHLEADDHVSQFDVRTLTDALKSAGFTGVAVNTVSWREYGRWIPLHVLYDTVFFGAPQRIHHNRHELIRAVARTSA